MLSLLFTIAVKSNQKGLGLFLCLWKLQKRFPHAKQTVSLVLCSFILASPLYCFLTSIKSRPFSNYQVTVFIKIWIVNFEILNMKWRVLMWLRYNFSKEKSLSHQFTGLAVYQFTVISLQFTVTTILLHHRLTTDNGQRRTHHSRLTTHY
jgi:hypothetical protein